MTSAQGTVTSCGPSQPFSLQFTCTGPSCAGLNGFPNTTCTTDGDTLTCTNNVICPGSTNYTSDFSLAQSNIIVSQTQRITLEDFCEEIDLASDGTTGGTNATRIDTGSCGPGSSNSSTAITSSTSSTVPPSSGFLPSTASRNGTYTPPTQPSTTSFPFVSDKSATAGTNSKSYQTLSGSFATPGTLWSNNGEILATSSSSWTPWTATGNSGSSPIAQEPSVTNSIPIALASEDDSGTRVTETVHMSTWLASQSTSHIGFGLSSQAGYSPSGASTGAGPSTAASGLPINTGSSQSSSSGSASFTSPTPEAWPAGSSGAVISGTVNSNPSGTPVTDGNGSATTLDSSTGGYSAAPIAQFTNIAGSVRPRNAPAVWCVLLLLFGFLIQATHASTYMSHGTAAEFTPEEQDVPANSALVNYTQHELTKRKVTPGWKAFSDAFSEYLAGKLSSPEFADNLVEELAKAVCDHAAGQAITKVLGVDLVETCVTAIYTGNALVAPELEFLSVFGASVVCNLLVSEALPGIGALTEAICAEPKPCSEDLLTDPNNCGSCGNVVSYILPPGAYKFPSCNYLPNASCPLHKTDNF
jgi:hypothetical protein